MALAERHSARLGRPLQHPAQQSAGAGFAVPLGLEPAALHRLLLDQGWLDGRSARHQPYARLGRNQSLRDGIRELSVCPEGDEFLGAC